jgi:hypothetical protein
MAFIFPQSARNEEPVEPFPNSKDAQGNDQPAKMTIKLKGENLSTDASIKVDNDDLRNDEFTVPIDRSKTQDAPADPSFRSELTLVLEKADKFIEEEHSLTFTNNKGGQMAVTKFPIDPLTVKGSILSITAGTAPVTITLQGANFEDNMSAEWSDAAKSPPTPVLVKKKSDKEAEITFSPGATTGAGKLTLISAIKLRASTPVRVVPAELKLKLIKSLSPGTSEVVLSVNGENFEDNMTAEWIDPAKNTTALSADKVKKKSDKEAEVKLIPGTTKGEGKLTLIGTNQRASTPLKVVDPGELH